MTRILRSAEIRVPRTCTVKDLQNFIDIVPDDSKIEFTARVGDQSDPRERGLIEIIVKATWIENMNQEKS